MKPISSLSQAPFHCPTGDGMSRTDKPTEDTTKGAELDALTATKARTIVAGGGGEGHLARRGQRLEPGSRPCNHSGVTAGFKEEPLKNRPAAITALATYMIE